MMRNLRKIGLVIAIALVLSACGSKWNVKVDLTPEQKQAILTEIETAKAEIKKFDWKGDPGLIPWAAIIDQAKAYEKLGDRKAAIDLYNSWLKGNVKTKAMINNLGRLYDQVGEYELAVKQYQRIVDEYMDSGYLYDITWVYIHAAQASDGKTAVDYRKKAEKYFNIWQLENKKTDEPTQEAIKKLRDEEARKPN